MSITYPINITDKDPSTFSYTPEELGITPVVANTALVVPETCDYSYMTGDWDGNQILVGNPLSIRIGKNASLDLLFADNMGDTYRHEIQSLAFEDGKTNLTENVTCYRVPGSATSAETSAVQAQLHALYEADHAAWENEYAAYETAHDAWQAAWDEYNEAHDAWDPESGDPEPEEPTGDEPEEPGYEPYEYDDKYQYNNQLVDGSGNYWYPNRTISDAVDAGTSLSSWCDSIFITKSLRLPEGIVNFGQFSFKHSYSDKESNVNDFHFHNPTDFQIHIPSTVTHFCILGVEVDERAPVSGDSIYYDPEYESFDWSVNALWFGYVSNMENGGLWRGETDQSLSYPSDEEDLPQFLEDTPHDTVHIYLRNHTTVPDIDFYGKIYFPIVFHVNGTIYNDFKNQYQGAVKFDPISVDTSSSTPYDFDPITIVSDAGEIPEIISVPLNTNLSPVILNGVQSLSDDDLSDAFAGIHLDWYKVNDAKINSAEATSENTYEFDQYISETDLETDENKIIHIVGNVEINGETEEPYPIITVSSANYVTMSGSTITETLGAVSGINITGDINYVHGDGEYVNMNTTYKGISISDSFLADGGEPTYQG